MESIGQGEGRPGSRRRSAVVQALMLGTNLSVGMGIFTLAGYYADYRRGHDGHVWTVVGMVLGFVYCGYEMWKTIRDLNETDPGASGRKGNDHGR